MSHQEEGGAVIKSGDATHSLSVKYCPAGDKYLVSRDGGPDQVCLLKRLCLHCYYRTFPCMFSS